MIPGQGQAGAVAGVVLVAAVELNGGKTGTLAKLSGDSRVDFILAVIDIIEFRIEMFK